MKVAVYPGSFNPWHDGHKNVLEQALKAFDKVVICQGFNPDKIYRAELIRETNEFGDYKGKVWVRHYSDLLKDFIDEIKPDAIIKGIRNAQDLEYETTQQYWNEDLGITIPTFYVITDRNLRHISSSAIRQVEKFK